MVKRIGIVGHYGANSNSTDGQTIKVKSFIQAFEEERPNIKIDLVDTYYMGRKPFVFCRDLLKTLLYDKKIVFFPAARGRKFMFPFFYWTKKILCKDIYHNCIAGSLDKEIPTHKNWLKYLRSFNVNWMESPAQVEDLKKMGLLNASYMPNFKVLNPITEGELRTYSVGDEFKFCVFSRIEPMKGIEDALTALVSLKKQGYNVHLDIYGPIQSGEEAWFEDVKVKYSDIFTYKGIVRYDKSVNVLKTYFALLFPTRYYTEGIPGTILDAMFAGVPVIARRWVWCDNLIKSGYNGISYDFDEPNKLHSVLENILKDPQIIIEMRHNCVRESNKYNPKTIIKSILKDMQL
jgi:glycosyltransferase involved in cell wall biosynthesis